MAKYYNRSRGVLAVSIGKGRSFPCPPRQWVEIAAEDEGHEDVRDLVRKGYLFREEVPAEPPAPVEEKTP